MQAESQALAGLKVMVIDDSNTIRRSAEIFLKQAGCEVILAEDGFEAQESGSLERLRDRWEIGAGGVDQ